MPCLAVVTKIVTLSLADRPPRRGSWLTTSPGSWPAFAGEYATLASSGCAASSAAAPAFVIPTTSGTSTSFGLQSASVSGPRPEKYAMSRVPRQYPLSSCHLPSRLHDPVSRCRRGRAESRTNASSSSGDLLDELLPDQRGKRSAGDRLAVELGEHRRERVRVADPDRDDELGRVADEPGVAVVVRRPRLAGDLAAGDRRALAGARPGRRPRGCR